MKNQKILALDQASQKTGWAIYKGTTLMNHGVISVSGSDPIKRIIKLVEKISLLIKENDITKVIMEEIGGGPEEDSAKNLHTFKVLAWVQAGIMFYCSYNEIPYETIQSSTWRKHCGIKTGAGVKRHSLKPADIAFVKKTYNITVSDDEADAIGIGYGYIHQSDVELNWD